MRYYVWDSLKHPGHPSIKPETQYVSAISKVVGGPFDTKEEAEAFIRAYLRDLAAHPPKG